MVFVLTRAVRRLFKHFGLAILPPPLVGMFVIFFGLLMLKDADAARCRTPHGSEPAACAQSLIPSRIEVRDSQRPLPVPARLRSLARVPSPMLAVCRGVEGIS